jgi:DNA-binding CsgD family transcriptional regulator
VRDALALLEKQAATWQDGWALAGAARARAAVLRADTELAAALVAASEAVDRHRLLPYPFERGRSLLAAGSIHRRLTHRREARAHLSEALGVFEGLGAGAWIALAQAELNRVGGRAPGVDVLTPSESAVADLVALGLSNAQVAERLVLATRTVESHLTQIYAKLGVRSRAELVRRQLTLG